MWFFRIPNIPPVTKVGAMIFVITLLIANWLLNLTNGNPLVVLGLTLLAIGLGLIANDK